MKRHVALVGFMASGKSTIGKQLARRLGWEFYDSDEAIMRLHGPIARVFADQGELTFRSYERTAIERALAAETPKVIAVGGGAPAHEPTRRLLEQGAYRVFLQVPLEHVRERVRRSKTLRPLLGRKPSPAEIQRLYQARLPAYLEAEFVLDCTALTVRAAAQALEEHLRGSGLLE